MIELSSSAFYQNFNKIITIVPVLFLYPSCTNTVLKVLLFFHTVLALDLTLKHLNIHKKTKKIVVHRSRNRKFWISWSRSRKN